MYLSTTWDPCSLNFSKYGQPVPEENLWGLISGMGFLQSRSLATRDPTNSVKTPKQCFEDIFRNDVACQVER